MTEPPANPSAVRARVVLPVPLPHAFDYLGSASARPGCRVRVPFGRTRRTGIVIDWTGNGPQADAARLKHIDSVLDAEPLIDTELLYNLRRAAEYWCGAPGEVLFGALPLALRDGAPIGTFAGEAWRSTQAGDTARAAHNRAARRHF